MSGTAKLGDFLTERDLNTIIDIMTSEHAIMIIVNRITEEVMQPNMERINAALKQENDPKYLAHEVYWLLHSAYQRKFTTANRIVLQ